jgi:hypothetical protein
MKRPAEIIFVEQDARWITTAEGRVPLGRWNAQFLVQETAEGHILGRPVSEKQSPVILTINEGYDGSYTWRTPGEWKPNGNRHESARDLSEAQDRIAKWAGRRFRVEVPR